MMSTYQSFDRNDGNSHVSGVRVSYSETVSARETATLAALTRRMDARGFTRAAEEQKEQMDSMEKEARTLSPSCYRWDELCADGRGANYRHGSYLGRQVMDVDDFAAYFETCRTRRSQTSAQDKVTSLASEPAAVPARTREESCYAKSAKTTALMESKKQQHVSAADRMIALAKEWLQPDDPAYRRRGQMQRIPVSVISVLVVVAVSLMLIVSSSVMVAGAKREVSALDNEVALLEKEAELATDRFESSINYLDIYQIATERYGMIPASFANSMYVDQNKQNTIENFEDDGEGTVGLSTLLSAIGIHFGGGES